MHAEALRHRWVVVVGAALLTAGCATLAPRPGPGAIVGPRAAPALRDTLSDASPPQPSSSAASTEPRTQGPLRRRHSERRRGTDVVLVSPEEMALHPEPSAEPTTQGSPSCGGHAVPEGWPDYSTWLDEELLAPFFLCASPAEFLALQRRVDMPRLVEALNDWDAVRLGALGPMETPAAQVLQRKRFSFLVNAPRLYGAYAQVLALFLFDTAFDDEVRELLVLLAKDKQLQQTLGPMEAVREQLEQRGFRLSEYPERKEQLSDVVRGLGRAAGDVVATIPVADGMRGGDVLSKQAELPLPYQQAFEATFQALMREHFAPGPVALGAFDSMTFGVPLGFYYLVVGTGHGVYTLTQGQYEQATRELAPAALMVGLYVGRKGARYLSEAKGVASLGAEGMRLPVLELRVQVLKEVVDRLRARLGESDFAQLMRWLQGSREVAVLVATHGEPFAIALVETRGDPVRAQAVLAVRNSQRSGPTSTSAHTAAGGATADPALRFPRSNLRGVSLKWLQRNKPGGWRQVPTRDSEGWIWLDRNGVERLRFMRPNGKNPSASQWARQSQGYFRWQDAAGNFLDVDGNVVGPDHPRFQELTHILYEGN